MSLSAHIRVSKPGDPRYYAKLRGGPFPQWATFGGPYPTEEMAGSVARDRLKNEDATEACVFLGRKKIEGSVILKKKTVLDRFKEMEIDG